MKDKFTAERGIADIWNQPVRKNSLTYVAEVGFSSRPEYSFACCACCACFTQGFSYPGWFTLGTSLREKGWIADMEPDLP